MTIKRIPPEFKLLFPAFEKKFLHGEVTNFSFQHKFVKAIPGRPDMMYQPVAKTLTEDEWMMHFFIAPEDIKPKKASHYRIGSMAMNGTFSGSILKWVAFDLDNQDVVNKAEKLLLPAFDARGIEYIWEESGDGDRAHVWIMIDAVERNLVEAYINQLILSVGLSRDDLDEIYPLFNKRKNVIRLAGGFHLRRGKRYPCVYKDQRSEDSNGKTDPLKIMRFFIDCKPITEADMRKWVKDLPAEESKKKPKTPLGNIKFQSLNMPLPFPEAELPVTLVKPLQNCMALSQTLKEIKGFDLNKRDATTHEKGLFWSRICTYNDIVLGSKKVPVKAGRDFFNMLKTKYRFRPAEGHNWDSNFNEMSDNPERYYPGCSAWERFGHCEGCQFKNVISSPRQFHWGEDIVREVIGEVSLKTVEEIRETTFKDFKQEVKRLMMFGVNETVLLASPQSSGKSWLLADIIKENPTKTVVIMVSDGNLAMQHKDKLESEGITAFVAMGYDNVFKYLSADPCEFPDEIKELTSLGMSGSYIREKICETCPLYDACHWPQQYKQLKEGGHRVIIMQHAHMGTTVMYDVMKSNPDMIFIDENFVQNLYEFIKPTKMEIETLKNFEDLGWPSKVVRWLQHGGWADGDINPTEEDMKAIKPYFSVKGINLRGSSDADWPKMVSMIRAYKGKHLCDRASGVRLVHEFPVAPLMILADATPPKELVEHLTGVKISKVIGKEEVIDVSRVHPDNRIYQIIDGSVSQSALEKDDLFYEMLAKIAYMCQTEYKGKQVLLTTYVKWVPRVIEYMRTHGNYSDILERLEIAQYPSDRAQRSIIQKLGIRVIGDKAPRKDSVTLDWMRRGTNRYVTYDAQFLMAGVFSTGDQFYHSAYEYKAVANYRLELKGQKTHSNVYPSDVTSKTKIFREPIPYQCVMKINGKGALVRFPQFPVWVPEDYWFSFHYGMGLGAFQQANRLRWAPDKGRHSWVMGNMPMDGYMVSDVITKAQFCNSF